MQYNLDLIVQGTLTTGPPALRILKECIVGKWAVGILLECFLVFHALVLPPRCAIYENNCLTHEWDNSFLWLTKTLAYF